MPNFFQYLVSDLNIKFMHSYLLELNKKRDLPRAGHHYYYGVVVYNFKLSFGYLATDKWSSFQKFTLSSKTKGTLK